MNQTLLQNDKLPIDPKIRHLDETPHPLLQFPELLDKAAEKVHLDLIKKTPKNPYSIALHVPFSDLTEAEKKKGRELILDASVILENIPSQYNKSDLQEKLASQFACAHHKKHHKEPWEKLDPNKKKESVERARIAVNALIEMNINIGKFLVQSLGKRFLAC